MKKHNLLKLFSSTRMFRNLLIALSIVIWLTVPHTTFAQISQDTSGYASVNGIKMYYEIYGKGKPLVLIHGGGSTYPRSIAPL